MVLVLLVSCKSKQATTENKESNRFQKIALEEAHRQLAHLHDWPKLCLVRPGAVATQPGQISPRPYARVDEWAETLIRILDTGPDLEINEVSLGVNYP